MEIYEQLHKMRNSTVLPVIWKEHGKSANSVQSSLTFLSTLKPLRIRERENSNNTRSANTCIKLLISSQS